MSLALAKRARDIGKGAAVSCRECRGCAGGLAAELKRRLTVRLYDVIYLLIVRCLHNNHLFVSHVRDGYTEVRRAGLEVGYTAVMTVGICKCYGEPCG